MKIERVRGFPGIAGCQPEMLGSLPSLIFVGKLPALPEPKKIET